MPNIENTAGELAGILRGQPADYIEARLEERETSQITYRGREMESIGQASASGGNIRAFVRGGWGFVSFNSLTDLADRVALAVKQAKLASTGENQLAPVAPATDRSVMMAANPLDIPLTEKKRLLDEYNDLIWQTPKIQTSVIGYGDSLKKTILMTSLGSHIEQTRADITLRLSAIATEGSEIQQAGFSVGSRGDFGAIKKLHREVAESTRNAVAMLSAPQVKGGEYTVVLDPILAGVFAHEAFGHLSESDFVYENDKLREVMVLGREFGGKELSIVDDPTMPGLRGSYKYDDEGVPARKNYLIREGKLVGRLHSRETAAKMGEPLSSNARAISYRYAPIVRMSNTYIEPHRASFDELIADIKEGIYAKNWYGGTTMMEMFTFSAGEAYMIRDGKLAEAVRPITLTGNVFETLKNIDAIGNDLDMNQGGGCGKGGQSPLPVSNGSPHIRIRHCLVGGK